MAEGSPLDAKVTALSKLVEPVSKLIDAVSSAVGSLNDPAMIKARAEARAVAKRVMAESQIEISELKERAQDRLLKKEARRQKNIESITEKAILALPGEANDEPPDEDWVHQFFAHSQDIGDEEMQTVWAKLLAGEVAQPGSYSILTMATLKTLGKKEADLFTRFCTYLWDYNGVLCPFLDIHPNERIANFSHIAALHLQSHGLIGLEGIAFSNKEHSSTLYYFGERFELTRGTYIALDASLTIAGEQLALISGAKPDWDYMRKVVRRHRHALVTPISDEELDKIGNDQERDGGPGQ